MIARRKKQNVTTAANASAQPQEAAKAPQSGFSSMLTDLGSALMGERTVRNIKNVSENPDEDALYGSVLDFKDMNAITGDMVGMTSNVDSINLTAREAIFEPMLIERLFAVHSAFKSNVNALVGSFNAAGSITLGAVTGSGLLITALSAIRPAFLGLAIRIKAANLEDGDTTVRVVKAGTGFDATFSLSESTDSGVVVVLNHAQDTTITDSLVNGILAGTDITCTATEVTAAVADQFYFDYASVSDWRIEGRNATVHTYLLTVNLELCALVYACIVEDRMNELPNLIASAYQRAKK